VLIPKLVGSSVGLHSLTVLVCTLVAADLMGVFGMVVAVPLTAVLKISRRSSSCRRCGAARGCRRSCPGP